MCVTLQDIVLDFSPGPIQAVDGDRGLRSPISYAILSGSTHSSEDCASTAPHSRACIKNCIYAHASGDDGGRFLLDRETGEMRLVRGVRDRLTSPTLHLNIMVVFQLCEEEKTHPCSSSFLSPPRSPVRHTSTTTPGSTPLRRHWSEFWR